MIANKFGRVLFCSRYAYVGFPEQGTDIVHVNILVLQQVQSYYVLRQRKLALTIYFYYLGTGGVIGPHYASSKSALSGLLHWISMRYAKEGVVRIFLCSYHMNLSHPYPFGRPAILSLLH